MSEATQPTPKKGLFRRLLKWGLIGLVALVLFVALAPFAAGPLLVGTVVSQVNARVNGEARLESLSVAPLGHVALAGFELDDSAGRPVARVQSLDVRAGLLAALGGHYTAQVELDGFELHAFQEQDGTWNVEGLAKETEAADEEPQSGEDGAGELPNVSAKVRVSNGRVVLHALDGETEVRELSFALDLESLEAPATLSLGARVTGEGLEPGELSARGNLTLAEGGTLGLDGLRGELELVIGALVLDALEPVLVVSSPVRRLAGTLDGQIDLTFHGGLAIEGDVRLDARSLDLATETEGEDGSVATMELVAAQWNTTLTAKGEGERFSFVGETSLDALEVEHGTRGGPPLPADEEAAALPSRVTEPRLSIAFDASALPEPASIDLTRLSFASTLLSGDVHGKLRDLRGIEGGEEAGLLVVEGLVGDLRWVPDRIAALLGPMIPGELSGAAEEPLRFTLNGRSADFEPDSLIAGYGLDATVGVGRYRNAGLDLTGTVRIGLADGIATLTGDLGANGGSLDLESTFDLRTPADGAPRAATRFAIKADAVRANSQLAPILGQLHPAFSGLDALKGGAIGGLVNAQLDLDYAGPLSPEELSGGWESIPKTPFEGSGSIGIDQAALAGSSFLTNALAQLGVDTTKDFGLSTLAFHISNGRLQYDKPWAWNISGSPTSFAGSVGLDNSVDLVWSVPLTKQLIGTTNFLEPLIGQTVELPIGGTLSSPRLEWKGVLSNLVKEALAAKAKDELKDAITDKIGDELGSDLGGKVGDVLDGIGKGEGLDLGGLIGGKKDGSTNDPEAILRQADQLWSAGKKTEAGALYKRLREDFKYTTTYLFNKSRIKDRAQ